MQLFQKELATEHTAKRAKISADFAPIASDVKLREEQGLEQLERRKKLLRSFGVDATETGPTDAGAPQQPEQQLQQQQQQPQQQQPSAPATAAATTGAKKRTASEAFTPSGSPSNDAASHAGSAAASDAAGHRSALAVEGALSC